MPANRIYEPVNVAIACKLAAVIAEVEPEGPPSEPFTEEQLEAITYGVVEKMGFSIDRSRAGRDVRRTIPRQLDTYIHQIKSRPSQVN